MTEIVEFNQSVGMKYFDYNFKLAANVKDVIDVGSQKVNVPTLQITWKTVRYSYSEIEMVIAPDFSHHTLPLVCVHNTNRKFLFVCR